MTRSTDSHALHLISTNARRGAEVFAVQLAEALGDGFPGRVAALSHAASGATLDVEVLGPSWKASSTLRALRRAMRDSSVVVAHGSVTLPAAILAGLGLGVPLVYKNIGDPWYWASNPRKRFQTAVLMRQVRYVAALTPGAADAIARCWLVPKDKIFVTGGGRSITAYRPPTPEERKAARGDLGLHLDDQVVLYLGALAAEKRPLLAVETALELPEAVFMLAGDGPQRELVERAAHDDRERIRVLGSRSDSRRLLHAADALLLTSESEGLPGVLIEAGLSGLPVVAADTGFVRDVVVDETTGVVVRTEEPKHFADALRRTLQSTTMGAAARGRCIEHFDVRLSQERWLNLLQRAAQQG